MRILRVRTFLIYILFVFGTLSSVAQEPGDTLLLAQTSDTLQLASLTDTLPLPAPKKKLSLIRRVIRGFDRLDNRYIEPQHYVFAAMLQATRNYDVYTLRSSGNNRQSMTFAPDQDFRVGPYAGWKWIFLGYTFSLNNLDMHSGKHEFDLSIYSSQIGVDLFYRRTGSDYKIRSASLRSGQDFSALEDQSFDGLKAGITGFNIYYIFNHGKFSYPAAFAQSTIQKISCGSWLAGFGYMHNSIELDHERLQQLVDLHMGAQTVPLDSGLMFKRIKYVDFTLSGGYAYNWVFARNWLLGMSAQLAVAHKRSTSQMANNNKKDRFSFSNLNIDGIGRMGIVYNNMRWYAGASAIVHSYNYHKLRFSTNNTFGSFNLYVGCNFGLKKKYRKKEL